MKILRVGATILMFILNYLASSLPINGLLTSDVSDKLTTLITPAWFTFGIWSLIYLGILIITVMVVMGKIVLSHRIMIWYIISAVANGLWIIVWQYQNLHLSMILILVLLVSLIIINTDIKKLTHSSYKPLLKNVFFLYLGRVQIATLLMFTIYLIYQLWWIDNQTVWWPAVVLILLGISNIIILKREKNITTSLVALRALWWILAASTNKTITIICWIVFWVLTVWSIVTIVLQSTSNKTKTTA